MTELDRSVHLATARDYASFRRCGEMGQALLVDAVLPQNYQLCSSALTMDSSQMCPHVYGVWAHSLCDKQHTL